VARMSVFGRRTDDRVAEDRADAEDRAATEERAAADDRAAGRDRAAAVEERTAERDREVADGDRVRIPTGRATVTEPTEERTVPVSTTTAPTVVSPTYAGRTSMLATLSLILGVTAIYGALSGRLAPVGLAAGVLGTLLAGGGLSAGSRRGVNGRGVAFLGLLLSLAGIVFAVLAMNHVTSWLNSDVDQVARLRDWMNLHLSWIKGW
jgi:hypothetical protein